MRIQSITLSVLSVFAAMIMPFSAATAGDGTLISWASGLNKQPTQVKPVQEKLNYSPSLAYIPSYTGKGYRTTEALHYRGLPTGDCYNVNYLMRENVDLVHAWYLDSLKQTGWSLDESSYIGTSISGVHPNGLRCFLYVRPSSKSGFGSELMLRYSARQN